MPVLHTENHLVAGIGRLRAAVPRANGGLIPTSSLIVGVAAAATASHEILVAGTAMPLVVAQIAPAETAATAIIGSLLGREI